MGRLKCGSWDIPLDVVYLILVSKKKSHNSAANSELEIDVESVIYFRIVLNPEVQFVLKR
jgi:hypothetical protein